MQNRENFYSTEQQRHIDNHLRFVLAHNEQVNLTTIKTLAEGRLLHIEDSLAGVDEVNSAPAGLLADIGSGGGFPGIPLAVVTGRKTVLIESIAKKAHVLQTFIQQEGLENKISVIAKRSEDLAREKGALFAAITIRAVGDLPLLVELAAPLLLEKGLLVCYKGQPDNEELERGRKAARICGLAEKGIRSCLLSDGATNRTFITYEKVTEATVSLPRRNGMAKKRPLA